MKKHFYIFLLFLVAPLCTFGQSAFELTVSEFDSTVAPGAYFTVLFELHTGSTSVPDITDSLSLPTGWKVLARKMVKPLDASNGFRFIYTIATPRFSSASVYPVSLRLFSNQVPVAQKSIAVHIQEIRKIEVTALTQPEYIKEGEELVIEYLIQNNGNTTERFKLQTQRGKVEYEGDSLVLAPNTSQKVAVRQTIPETGVGYWTTSSDLKLISRQTPDPLYTTVSVPVYATKVKKNDPYLRFPVEAGGGYLSYTLGNKVLSGYQYFARGSGNLDFSKKHYLEFLVAGPNQIRFPAVGSYDQYSVSYAYKGKTFITAGDYLFRFNNLMEFGRFGRGAMVEQYVGKTSYLLFYQKARFFPGQKDSFGGRVSYSVNESTKLSFNFISKNLLENRASFQSNLLGVSSSFRKDKIQIETEVSAGNANNKWDLAAFNQLFYSFGRFTLNNNAVYAGKNYYGFYRNSVQFVNSLSYAISRQVSVGANSNITRINPSLDANVYSTSPNNLSNTLFASYQPNDRNLFFVNYTLLEREDRQTPSQFHYKEDFGNFSYNLNAPRFTLFFQSRYGYAQNLLVPDQAGRKQSISNIVQPAARLVPWLWLGGYFEYQYTSKFSSVNEFQNLVYYGGSLRVNYKRTLNINFSYRNNYAPDELFVRRSFMDASVLLDLKHQQLSLTGGRAFLPNVVSTDQNTLFFNLRYVLKLNVPLRKNRNLGSISGTVKGLTSDVRPGGVLLQLGHQQVLTDSSGAFTFTDLVPDKYYIRVMSPLSEKGIIPTIKTPIEVTIQADSNQTIEVPFVKAGGIEGSIALEESENGAVLLADLPKPVIMIKLYNETESYLTLVNDKNRFSFKEIKPGNWTIKAMIKGNQERFEVVHQERPITVEPGNLVQASFIVRPIERKIFFSKQGFNLTSKEDE